MIGKAPSRVLVAHTGLEVGQAKVLPGACIAARTF